MTPDTPDRPIQGRALARAALVAPALILLADHLFLGHRIGLSLPLYAAALFAATAWAHRARARVRPALLLALAVLPSIEWPQPLSAVILAIGLAASVAWLRTGGPAGLPAALASMLREVPVRAPRDLPAAAAAARPGAGRLREAWLVPVLGSGVLAAPLVSANPPPRRDGRGRDGLGDRSGRDRAPPALLGRGGMARLGAARVADGTSDRACARPRLAARRQRRLGGPRARAVQRGPRDPDRARRRLPVGRGDAARRHDPCALRAARRLPPPRD